MNKEYKINKHNSTVCGYPGRDFDWSKFCWDGNEVHKALFKGDRDMKAPSSYIDDCLIPENCQYLHVPYNFREEGVIYRVRPNPTMYAGEIYQGHKIIRQKAVKRDGVWYWQLELED